MKVDSAVAFSYFVCLTYKENIFRYPDSNIRQSSKPSNYSLSVEYNEKNDEKMIIDKNYYKLGI